MRDLQSPALMWIKAGLFITAGVLGAVAILVERPQAGIAFLLVITVWCFARAYYFAFYVIERYVDGEYQYTGLWSLVRHATRRRPRPGGLPAVHPTQIAQFNDSPRLPAGAPKQARPPA